MTTNSTKIIFCSVNCTFLASSLIYDVLNVHCQLSHKLRNEDAIDESICCCDHHMIQVDHSRLRSTRPLATKFARFESGRIQRMEHTAREDLPTSYQRTGWSEASAAYWMV